MEVCQNPKYQHENVQKPQSAPLGEDCGFLRPHKNLKGGEIRDVFKFTYEDRPYVCLSGSERIRAGLEVAELVKGLLGVDFPVFIDDAERVPVIDNVRPTGQIFIAKVAKGVKLTVQTASATPPAQAA